MKKLVLLGFLVISMTAFTQNDTTKNWTTKGNASLNFSESYFSNWSAGGDNSLNLIAKYTMSADYKKDRHSWNNWIDLAFGYNLIGKNEPMKTEDKIEFISAYNYNLKKSWEFTVMASFKSQFANGFDYEKDSTNNVSGFMAPAYIDLGPGISYKPSDHFLAYFSPVTPRWIVVLDQKLANEGAFGLTPADTLNGVVQNAKRVQSQFGAKLLLTINYEVAKNVKIASKLELFSDYLNNPQNIDVNWQVLVDLKVNSWLNVTFSTELIYDDDVTIYDANNVALGPRTQFKQMLMVGIGYSF